MKLGTKLLAAPLLTALVVLGVRTSQHAVDEPGRDANHTFTA